MSLSPVHHCALTVSDLDRSVAFYTEILGFRMGLEFPLNPAHNRAFLHVPRGTSARCAMLQHGTSTVGQIELLEFDPPIPSGASPMRPGDVGLFLMSFEVHEETLQQICERLRTRGIEFWSEPCSFSIQDYGTMQAVIFEDPDGVLIELIQLPDPESVRNLRRARRGEAT